VIPALLSSFAWIASVSRDGCDYSKVHGQVVNELTGDESIPYLQFGMNAFRIPNYHAETETWHPEFSGSCTSYDEVYVRSDFPWKLSRALAFVSIVLGGGGKERFYAISVYVSMASHMREVV